MKIHVLVKFINLNNLYFKYQNIKSKRLNDKVNYKIYSEIVKYIE